jgi:hypothetical protein
VHKRATSKHGFIKLITAQTWGKPPPSPLIEFYVLGHRAYIQMSFCPEIPKFEVLKFPKLGLSWLWKPIPSCVDLVLRQGLRESCSPFQKKFNDMWQKTCTQVNQGDSWFLVVESQIAQIGSLIPGLSFGHNLCFKYPNGSCEPILNIYVSINFNDIRSSSI